MKTIFVIVLGYLLGSIATGVLIARRVRPDIDLHTIGSGNIGATNVARALGKKWGVVTMLGDCVKGLVPVLVARYLELSPPIAMLAGLAAFVGHLYPVFFKFEGGKGVATALGVFIGLSPITALLAFIVWAGTSIIAQTTTVGALSAALAIPILAIGAAPQGDYRDPTIVASFMIAPYVFYKHRENIKRIVRGQSQPGR